MSFFANLLSGAGGKILSGASDIISKFKADPTKVVEVEAELEKLRITTETEMARIAAQADAEMSKQIESVNATMREEAKSEHWMQWAWRPSVGFLFVAIGLNNYVVMPYLKHKGLQPVEIPSEMFMAILAILGVASWHRGVAKVEKVKNK